ncbi:g1494 [Coccomyxa elongata]
MCRGETLRSARLAGSPDTAPQASNFIDVNAQLKTLLDRYPGASRSARDAVQTMHAEYEKLLGANQTCQLISRASFHSSGSCSGINDETENIPGATHNRRASDIPESHSRASTGGTSSSRRSKDPLEKVSWRPGSADLCRNKRSGIEAEPHLAGDLGSSRRSSASTEGGGPAEGYRACFGRLRRRCMQEAAGQGGGREAALQLLATALPGKGLDEIRELDRRHSQDTRRRHMQASSSADADRRAARLVAQAEARLARSAEAAERRAQAAAEVHSCLVDTPAAIREEARGKQRAELAVIARRRAAAAAQAELARTAAAQAAAAEAEKRQRAEHRTRERDAAALAQHKAAAVAQQESVMRSRAEAAAAAAWQSQQQAAADAARVAHRERLRAEKAAARDAAAAADAAAAHRREQRILDLAAQASLEVKVAVAADPARVQAPTAASAAPAAPVMRAFKPVHGYTTADILRDKRFKVRVAKGWHESMPCWEQEMWPP